MSYKPIDTIQNIWLQVGTNSKIKSVATYQLKVDGVNETMLSTLDILPF